MAKLVAKLAERGFAPGLIATSPLLRCRQTAEVVAEGLSGKPKVVVRDELAPEADWSGLARWTLQHAEHEEIAWVGHAPGVGQMAAAWIGAGAAGIDLAKGAVAAIHFDGPAKLGEGELRWLVTAKLLGC